MQLYAGFILKTTDNKLLLQQRDNKPNITNPGMIAIFGGTAKASETSTDCAKREALEEVDLSINKKNLKPLATYHTTVPSVGEVESHIFLIEGVKQSNLHLKEGKGIFILDPNQDITILNLTPVCRLALTNYLERF
jgi:8-oxo-dGTP pyrophosphatase MutT (NUDIX family)